MTAPTRTWWAQLGALIGGMAAVATIHGVVVVPAILAQSENTARALIASHVADEARALEERRAKFVTQDEFKLLRADMDRIYQQLARIEARLSEPR